MAGRGGWERFLLVLLLAAVAFFGWMTITAIDRQSRELRLLREELARRPAAVATAASGMASGGGDRAGNAEFFDPAATSGGRLVQAIAADIGSLNPITGNEATASEILGLCTSTLGTRNFARPEEFVPLMAESWESSADHKTFRIRLRKGVLWHDFTDPETGEKVAPREVTAADFVFYLDVIRNPKVNAAVLRGYYQDLEYIRAINDYELEIRWRNEYFRSLELSLGLAPLPRHFYCPGGRVFDPEKFNDDHERNRMVVGCGPYKLEQWVRDQRFVLRRFNRYFGNELGIAPPLETVVFEIVKAPNTRFQMLLAGELDELGLLPEQWEKRAGEKPFSHSVLGVGMSAADQPLAPGETIRRARYLASAYYYIGYNLRHPLFQDKRVRQALTLLTDRERILRDVFCDRGRVISGPFFYDSPYYDREIAPWPFDPARAKALLAEAGWRDTDGDGILDKDGRRFEYTALQVAGNPIQEKILTIVKEDLARAGIEMKIAVFEWPVYIEKLEKRSYEVCSLGWSLPYESDPYQVWHSSQADTPMGSNHVGFKHPEADRIIESIRRTFDVPERIALCHRFQALLHEEQPYTFLIVPESLKALSGRYRNVRVFPLGLNSDCFWTPPAEQKTFGE